jgi:hypothetical protein
MQPPSLRAPLSLLAFGLLITIFLLTRPTDDQVVHSQGYGAPATAVPVPATATPVPTIAVVSTPIQAAPTTLIATPLPPTPIIPTAWPLPTNRPIQPTAVPIAPTEISQLKSTITCASGLPVEIAGVAPPRAALLLYFGQRAVGGGSAASDGSFKLILNVGDERSGSYPVSVLVRGSWQEVASTTCVVPYLSPTPRIVN